MDGGAWQAAVHGVAKSQTRLSNFTFCFHFYTLEKEMATHSSVLAWRIPATAEPGGLLSMGLHRVGHDWHDLAAAATAAKYNSAITKELKGIYSISYSQVHNYDSKINTTSKWLCHQLLRFGLKTQNFREVEKVCIPCSVLKVFLKSKPALKTVLSNWGGGGE